MSDQLQSYLSAVGFDKLDEFLGNHGISADTGPDIKLILWILLEQRGILREAENSDGGADVKSKIQNEKLPKTRKRRIEIDGLSGTAPKKNHTDGTTRYVNQWGGGLSREQRKALQKKILHLPKFVADNIPFDKLTNYQKSQLLEEISASCAFVKNERCTSFAQLCEVLGRRSKFHEDFDVVGVLGEGGYGKVTLVVPKGIEASSENLQKSAVKQIPLSPDEIRDEILLALNEKTSLEKLRGHPNVVEFYNSWLEASAVRPGQNTSFVYYLHMELCGDSLEKWKESQSPRKRDDGFKMKCEMILDQMLDGLAWIHGKGILHLDIKPANIFWKDKTQQCVKIGDFGLSVHADRIDEDRGSTPYRAPEAVLTSKSDVYSAGVTILEIALVTRTYQELVKRVEAKTISTGIDIIDKVLPAMLMDDASKRPSATDLQDLIKNLRRQQ